MLPNLRALRMETGTSQQTLADAIGFSQQSINQYENHNVQPDIATLKKIADYFGTTIDYIVGYADTRYPIADTTAYYLSENEGDIITKFRSLSPKERACVAQVIDTLLEK